MSELLIVGLCLVILSYALDAADAPGEGSSAVLGLACIIIGAYQALRR